MNNVNDSEELKKFVGLYSNFNQNYYIFLQLCDQMFALSKITKVPKIARIYKFSKSTKKKVVIIKHVLPRRKYSLQKLKDLGPFTSFLAITSIHVCVSVALPGIFDCCRPVEMMIWTIFSTLYAGFGIETGETLTIYTFLYIVLIIYILFMTLYK